jgi:omega-hydroxy-beta-dihydromenaquinone-9 sulfotransferase
MANRRQLSTVKKHKTDPFRFWHMRFWHGMTFLVWLKLLCRYRFKISGSRIFLALSVSLTSALNSVLRLIQEIVFYPVISRARIDKPPVFIIGHWRSGTTLLHELMVLDDQFTFASTYQCMAPSHFLLTGRIATRLEFLLPKKRPMDEMAAGWKQPQEDEFALLNLGQPSPYRAIAFPNESEKTDTLSLDGLTKGQRRGWSRALLGFLRRVTIQNKKQIIVKSPTHTARIKTLLEIFPDAKFVFIVRHPEQVFGSTVKLWRALDRSQSLQTSDEVGWDEKVLGDFEVLFSAFERDRPLIPEGHFFQTRYEDLLSDPLGEMETIYRHLDLGDFSKTRSKIERYFAARAEFRADSYDLTPAQRQQIKRRWGRFMGKYGY